ncbi:MAG: GH92 family glycosyl hydrolase [Kiritimatiellia bacterium]
MGVVACCLASAALAAGAGLVDYALPLVGTANTPAISCGNLYPCMARPWGAHAWTPQTGDNGADRIYDYADQRLRGIRLTHQPSPWIGDYGPLALLPTKELTRFDPEARASWFSHKTECARPHLYRVYLADYDTTVEVTPTCSAAILRATYPPTDAPQFVVDAFAGGEILQAEGRTVEGVSRQAKVRWNERRRERPLENFFSITFDRPFVAVAREGSAVAVRFAPMRNGGQVCARVAASFVSPEQARHNLREVADKSFDTVAAEGAAEWNRVLSRVRLGETDLDRRRMFYTCLYRALLFPRRFFDLAPDGRPVHRSPHTLEVRPGRYYCDTGFWDTFRALFPLLNLLYPEMNREMTEGLLRCYEEGGWLPEWSSPGYRHCMLGNHSASVVADAFLSGAAAGVDTNRLYAALLHGANAVHPTITSEGRLGYEHYNAKGYVPRDVGIGESAARTLEYAYDDWCIWRLGSLLGRPADELATYRRRAGNWRNVFDPAHGLACGRNADGSFDADFRPFRWGGDFVEGNALHYTWSVFHDIAGLMAAMGGREQFAARLDSVFALPPVFDESHYGAVIHEIREMQVVGFGQYAHGNQPIQHMPYLYAWCGQPWKTQRRVNEIVTRLYRPTPDGYCGDEDNGQTSAWYVWSSLGFYPVCPGTQEYALGAPQVPSARLAFGDRTLSIRAVAPDGGPVADVAAMPYVARLTLNGRVLDRNYVTRTELLAGGELVFTMSPTPDFVRGTSPSAAPYSLSAE